MEIIKYAILPFLIIGYYLALPIIWSIETIMSLIEKGNDAPANRP